LYYSDDMETFATGLKRIKDLCDEAGCKVEFRTEVDDFVVAFYRNLREEWNKSDSKSFSSTTKRLPRDYQVKKGAHKGYYERRPDGFCSCYTRSSQHISRMIAPMSSPMILFFQLFLKKRHLPLSQRFPGFGIAWMKAR
jgi:hypothetical protein